MKEFISSDFANHTMLADQAFNKILDNVQKSNLNFQLQVSPFSALISLKKSLVKDRSGSLLLPPTPLTTVQSPLPSSPTMNADLGELLAKIEELKSDLLSQKNNHEDASKKLKIYEENSNKLDKENKTLKQENKSLVGKLETKILEATQLKATVVELNREKNVLSVALKSAKQDLKIQSKASEGKLVKYEKKLSELNEFKTKKLNEERQEKIRKKKELRKEAKKRENNNKKPNNDTPAVKEEVSDEKNGKKDDESDFAVEFENRNCFSVVKESDPISAHSKSCVQNPDNNHPLSEKSVETSEEGHRDIELEVKEEGFIGPRLPRMLTDKKVKALFERLLGDKYK